VDGVAGAAALEPLPNSQRHRRTKAPACGAATGTSAGAGVDTGIGMMGAADAGKMLGTKGTSPCGFLSRFPIFESSTTGWSAS
jgi:hypothetical protein